MEFSAALALIASVSLALVAALAYIGRLLRAVDVWQDRYYRSLVERERARLPKLTESSRLVVLDLATFRDRLNKSLGNADLVELAFDLDIELPTGETKAEKIIHLLSELRNRKRLEDLVEWITTKRPDIRVIEE